MGTAQGLGNIKKHEQHCKSVSKPLCYNVSLDYNLIEYASILRKSAQSQMEAVVLSTPALCVVSVGGQGHPRGTAY